MPPSMQRASLFWRWSMGISVWCVCSNTHASFHSKGFNIFEGEALKYVWCLCTNTHVFLLCSGFQYLWRWISGILVWCVCITPIPPSMQKVSIFWRWSIGISVWCVCTNTHAFLNVEGFNVFKGGALEYLFDACAVKPMPPSMQRVIMFWKVGHWNICLQCACTNTHASFHAEGFNVCEGGALNICVMRVH